MASSPPTWLPRPELPVLAFLELTFLELTFLELFARDGIS